MVNCLYIARGLPGSGKTTAIHNHMMFIHDEAGKDNKLYPSMAWCEADYFHGTPYNWKQENQQKAHEFCRLTTQAHINNGVNHVFVGNTNIKKKDYQPYIDMALQADYNIYFIMPDTVWGWDVDECFRRNVHKVPKETIQRMKDQFEKDDRYGIIGVRTIKV